jgi:hypothetical protein
MFVLHLPTAAVTAIHSAQFIPMTLQAWKEWAGGCPVVSVVLHLAATARGELLTTAIRARI